jgi:RNA methyltransferase, TrmH family
VITSVDNGRVKDVLRLRRSRERRRAGMFVAEGTREVERALAAGLVARALYVAPELLPDYVPSGLAVRAAAVRAAAGQMAPAAGDSCAPSRTAGGPPARSRPAGRTSAGQMAAAAGDSCAPYRRPVDPPSTSMPGNRLDMSDDLGGGVEEVSARVLAKMAYRGEPEGVLGVFEIPQRELPVEPTLILVAVRIEKPGNLGAMARTADAAGADALLVADAAADPWNPNAIRASTGAVFTLPILDATLDDVRALPVQTVAAVVAAPTPYTGADLTLPTALVVGAEDEGLDAAWCEAADLQVSVPMSARTADSLNAATTAAILLFEAVRQRSAE